MKMPAGERFATMAARLAGGILLIASSAAPGVTMGDLIAPNMCVDGEADQETGECAAGEAADGEVLLKEDVVRVRLIDSTATNAAADGELGKSWSLLPNDYGPASDPRSYFGFTVRSIDETPDDGNNNIVAKHLLRLGTADGNATAIGGDSELVDGTVSLGNAYTKRRLVHVARAIEATDVLIKRQLDEGLLGSVAQLNSRLDAIEAEIAALESRVADDAAVGSDRNSGGGSVGLSALAVLAVLLLAHEGRGCARHCNGVAQPFARWRP